MAVFRDFESEVLRLLVAPELGPAAVETLLQEAELVSYSYSGSGYFLTVRHPSLLTQRIVCTRPQLVGRAGALESGFVVFIENGELMLECHSWGPATVPPDFREQAVVIARA
ncbi:MAG: hypothetical protein ACAI44_39965 [Candidatus Sericytochromatia bacterium]